MADSTRKALDRTTVALVIAHPGHELRVFRWIEQTRPLVCILTDGSGSTGVSRVDSSRRVVHGVDATMGPWQGRVRDRDVYQWLLSGAHGCFLGLVNELADIFASHGIRTVAADAAEGFNPGHDVCRLLVNAALTRLSSRGIHIDSYEFVLDRSPSDMPSASLGQIRLALDDAELDRKLRAAENYPELKLEVDRALPRMDATHSGRNVSGVCRTRSICHPSIRGCRGTSDMAPSASPQASTER